MSANPVISDATMQLLLQIPLAGVVVLVVGIFLWFLEKWARSERDARAKESAAEREARANESTAEREARAAENNMMREFLREQTEKTNAMFREIREANNQALGRLADEIKANTTQLSELKGIVLARGSGESRARGERG